MKKISVVVPVYRNQTTLKELTERLVVTIRSIPLEPEIIYVNDSSPDDSWNVIRSIKSQYSEVKAVNLSRNFGQHSAIAAGIDSAQGDWLVVMDADLQDSPEEIANLYHEAVKKNADCVLAVRQQREDSFFKKFSSKVFYSIFNILVGTKIDYTVGNFGIYSKTVYEATKALPERNRFFPLIIYWLGFKQERLSVKHNSRRDGESAYTLTKLIRLALYTIINHTNRPLYFCIFVGAFISIVSLVVGGFYFVRGLIEENQAVMGWTSLIVSIHFLSGIILLSTGIVGIYVGNIFNEVKGRPTYVIKERL